ncbi:MAG TPA: G1 family glutamic endopeptidase [Candidatus Angelobacter sp.]
MPKRQAAVHPRRLEHVIVPEVETLITLQTAPKAVCKLRHDTVKDKHLQLDADDGGIVRLHARASRDSKPIELRLEATDEDGKTTEYTIALRADAREGARLKKGGEDKAVPKIHGTLRPALEGDPLKPSNKELLEAGYPPRPDPGKSPVRYARWLKRVSRPFTSVTPRRVPHPDVSFTRRQLPPVLRSPTLPLPPPAARSMFNTNLSTWSGAYLTNPAAQFFLIEADWNVPGVAALLDSPPYSAAAEWVGLDNSGTDLFQSGTDSECWIIPFFGWTFTNYWMWIQSLPAVPYAVPNFHVSPGDEVSVDIFLADQFGTTWFKNGSNGGLTPADNNVWFMLYNYSNGSSFWGTLSTSTGFSGATAEFIIERPSDSNGNPYPLAAFGFATMWSNFYGDSEYGDRLWALGANGSSPFDGTLTYINMVDPSNNNLLALSLSMPDPINPSGYEILWLWVNYF